MVALRKRTGFTSGTHRRVGPHVPHGVVGGRKGSSKMARTNLRKLIWGGLLACLLGSVVFTTWQVLNRGFPNSPSTPATHLSGSALQEVVNIGAWARLQTIEYFRTHKEWPRSATDIVPTRTLPPMNDDQGLGKQPCRTLRDFSLARIPSKSSTVVTYEYTYLGTPDKYFIDLDYLFDPDHLQYGDGFTFKDGTRPTKRGSEWTVGPPSP